MMHPSCNVNTSTNLYDPSRVLEDYYNSSPSFFPTSPSLHHHYLHGDGENNIEDNFFQDLLENHHEMMIQQQQNPVENYISCIDNSNNNDNNDKSKRGGIEKISSPGKKVSKKDRHTKIETAQGPRDRRMRLSLNIARRFFDLQDMLGFDKASKTVEWLLTKSVSAITELSTNSFQQQVSSLSSTSEIVMDDLSSNNNGKLEKAMPNKKNSKKPKKVVRAIRPVTKKSREKARERARERTNEKMQKRRELTRTIDVVGHGSSFLGSGSWIPSSTFLNLQQNDGIINGLPIFEPINSNDSNKVQDFCSHRGNLTITTTELEHLSGDLGGASIW